MEEFRPIAVLGRGHFGKVSVRRVSPQSPNITRSILVLPDTLRGQNSVRARNKLLNQIEDNSFGQV